VLTESGSTAGSTNRADVMNNDEAEIKELIERWVRAVHAGDMNGVPDHGEADNAAAF
jgi:ketosteroid isomerase-like protein